MMAQVATVPRNDVPGELDSRSEALPAGVGPDLKRCLQAWGSSGAAVGGALRVAVGKQCGGVKGCSGAAVGWQACGKCQCNGLTVGKEQRDSKHTGTVQGHALISPSQCPTLGR